MKKILTISALLGGMTCFSQAAVIAQDQFEVGGSDYFSGFQIQAQGPLITGFSANPWLNDNNATVSATGLDYADAAYLAESGGSVTVAAGQINGRQGREFATTYDGSTDGVFYLSFLMQTGTDNELSYRAFELHNGGFNDGAHREFQLGFQNGDFMSGGTNYGFRVNGTATALGANDGLVNLFVVKFDLSSTANSDSVTVWHNPNLNTNVDPTGGTTVSGFDIEFDRATFAKYGDSGVVSWDELRLGDTFSDVTGAVEVVPEPSSTALIALGGLGLLARRKR